MTEFVVCAGVLMNLLLAFFTGWWFKERILNPPPLKDDQVRQLWNRMQDISTDVACNIDEHSKRVGQLSQELDTLQSADDTPERNSAQRDIVAQILAANKQLHEQLAASERRIQQQVQTIQNMSTETRIDPLTNLANRRAFDEELARRYAAWQFRRNPLALLLIGLDHLPEIRTKHGQEAVNEVLREVGTALAAAVREMDVVARYGDAEFVIVLPETNVGEGKILAEHFRAAVQAAKINFKGHELAVTISVGVAEVQEGDDLASFLSHAELALLAAQENGQGRTHFYSDRGCQPIVPGESGEDGEPQRGRRYGAGAAALTSSELRGHTRQMFLRTELIAPYSGEQLPEQADFTEIQCFDISSGGISFFLPGPPEHETYVLALGRPPQVIHTVAQVVRVAVTRLHTMPMYIIGCKFAGRIQPAGKTQRMPVGAAV